jgi:hypothetical protein
MKALNIVLRASGVFVATVIFQALSEIVIPIKGPAIPHLAQWAILSSALVTATLTVLALRSDWRGWKLGAAVAVIPMAIAAVNLLEGAVFLTNTNLQWGRIFSVTLLSYALTIPVWALLFGRREIVPEHYRPLESKSAGERAWKFAVSDFSYLFLYYAAGTIIFPYVKDFYATQHLPSTGSLIALQLLIRGPVFVVLCLAITRMLGLSRISGALAAGAIFTLLSGVAPLLIPSPVFPDSVRWVHFAEVTGSNFVFGVIVGWLWGQPKLSHSPALAQAA